jgi:hypothetical protein
VIGRGILSRLLTRVGLVHKLQLSIRLTRDS